MSSSPAVREIIKASATRKDPERYSRPELSREIARLQKLRSTAIRLNQESARDAVAAAEAKAPALNVANGFMPNAEVEELRAEIAFGSEVISRHILVALDHRIGLLRLERALRAPKAN